MTTNRYFLGNLLGAATFGGLIIAAPALSAQEGKPHPRNHPPAREHGEAGNPQVAQRIRQMMREMAELKRAGKHDEAREMAGKIRGIAGENPRLAEVIKRTIEQGEKPEMKSDRRPDKVPEGAMQVARVKMQKLGQAAELLQSAGYEEQAVRARAEIGRIEKEVRGEGAAAEERNADKPQKAGKPHQAEKSPKPDKAHKPQKHHKAKKAHKSQKTDKHRKAKHHKAAKPWMNRPGSGGPVMEELRKLRRDLDELRSELRRSKAENAPKPLPGRSQEKRPMDVR